MRGRGLQRQAALRIGSPTTRTDERQALCWLVLVGSHPLCSTFAWRFYKTLLQSMLEINVPGSNDYVYIFYKKYPVLRVSSGV